MEYSILMRERERERERGRKEERTELYSAFSFKTLERGSEA